MKPTKVTYSLSLFWSNNNKHNPKIDLITDRIIKWQKLGSPNNLILFLMCSNLLCLHKVQPFLKLHILFKGLIEYFKLRELQLSNKLRRSKWVTLQNSKCKLNLLHQLESTHILLQPHTRLLTLRCSIIKKVRRTKVAPFSMSVSLLEQDTLKPIRFRNSEAENLRNQIWDLRYIKELRGTQQVRITVWKLAISQNLQISEIVNIVIMMTKTQIIEAYQQIAKMDWYKQALNLLQMQVRRII